MFGIGLPEMILILALALIVVGPDKLPDLARSIAKTILDLKKTAESLKASFHEEGNPLSDIHPELEDAARSLKTNLLEQPNSAKQPDTPLTGVNPSTPDELQPSQTAVDADNVEVSGSAAIDTADPIGNQPPDPPPSATLSESSDDKTVTRTSDNDGK